jgi:hypothetical protein
MGESRHLQAAILYQAKCFATPPAKADGKDWGSDPLIPLINPESISSAERLDLRKKIQSGELMGLRFWAIVFGDERNMNGARPRPGQLEALGLSAHKRSVLYGHWPSMSSKKGRLLDHRVVDNAERGVEQLALLNEVVEEDAMLDLVNLKIGEFSISLKASKWVCSICDKEARFGWWGPELGCRCNPDEAELFGEAPVEIMHNAVVSQGAYRDTRIAEDFSAANRAARVEGAEFMGMKKPLNQRPPRRKSADLGAELASVLEAAKIAYQESEDISEEEALTALADASGLSEDDVTSLLAGEDLEVTEEQLQSMADLLGIELSELTDAAEEDGMTVTAAEEDDDDAAEDDDTGGGEVAPPGEGEDLAAENKRLRARVTELEGRIFAAAFDAAVLDGSVLPAAKAQYQQVADGNLDLAIGLLEGRASGGEGILPTKRRSTSVDNGDPEDNPRYAMLAEMEKAGRMPKGTVQKARERDAARGR